MGMPIMPHGQMIMMLHISRPRRIQWTLELNGHVVADFQRPEDSWSPDQGHEQTQYAPMGK